MVLWQLYRWQYINPEDKKAQMTKCQELQFACERSDIRNPSRFFCSVSPDCLMKFFLRFSLSLRKNLLCPLDCAKDEFLNLFLCVAGMQTDTETACSNSGGCYWTGVKTQREEMCREGPRHRGHKWDDMTWWQRGVLISEMRGEWKEIGGYSGKSRP